MKATIDGVTYEGSEDEIRRIVSDPPERPVVVPRWTASTPPTGFIKNWDGSPMVTCQIEMEAIQ